MAAKRGQRNGKKYGLFTPAAIAETMEIAKNLPGPVDSATIKKLGYKIRPGWCRAIIDLPIGIAWRAQKLRVARGVSRGRIYEEIITYYIVNVPDAALDGIPAAYDQFNTPEGLEVLTRALVAAQQRIGYITLGEMAAENPPDVEMGVTPSYHSDRSRPPVEPPEPEPISDEEKRELADFDMNAFK